MGLKINKLKNLKGNTWFEHDGVYLIEVDSNNSITSYDGVHSLKNEVEKALYLYKRLNFYNPNKSYFMLKKDKGIFSIHSIQKNNKFDVDEESINICNLMMNQ